MRHRNSGRQLGRNSGHRRALFRNMVTSLLEHGSLQTTDAKAKELRRVVEKVITLGKRGDIHARRQAAAYVREPGVVAKLFGEIGPKFAGRPGGYTRIIKVGLRRGDAAPMSLLQLVDEPCTPKVKRNKTAPAAEVAEAPRAEQGTSGEG